MIDDSLVSTVEGGNGHGTGGLTPRPKSRTSSMDYLKQLKKLFLDYLYFDPGQIMVLEFVLSMVLGNRWFRQTDPLWGHLVGPPGCGKSTILDALGGSDDFYLIDSLTPNSFVSGYRDSDNKGNDPSLLPLIDGKIMVVLDFSTVLSLRYEQQQAIFSDLRRLYDSGEIRKHKGNIGMMEYNSRFGMLTAVTQDVERLSMQVAPLGERFLVYRMGMEDRVAFQTKSIDWINQKSDVREELRKVTGQLLQSIPHVNADDIKFTGKQLEVVCVLADVMSAWRTYVPRDRTTSSRDPYYIPSPEAPGRLTTQLFLLAESHAVLYNRMEVTDEDLPLVARVAWNSLPSWRTTLLRLFMGGEALTSMTVRDLLGVDPRTLRRHLEDLTLLKLLHVVRKGTYVMAPRYQKRLEIAKPFLPEFDKL